MSADKAAKIGGGAKGLRKAAVLLIGLGSSAAAKIFSELNDSEIEVLTREMAVMDNVKSDDFENAANELSQMLTANKAILLGGIDYARSVLMEALSPGEAVKIIERVRKSADAHNIGGLGKLHQEQFANLLSQEHPQTIAFIISQIDNEQAGKVLAQFGEKLRNDVIIRLAKMKTIDRSLVGEVERALASTLDLQIRHEKAGGVEMTAAVLNHIGQQAERSALRTLEEVEPALAKEIEKHMFVFEFILQLEDADIQKILKNVDIKELAISLKTSSEDLKLRIFTNMSERARTMLEEEIEYMGKVRLRDVETVQQKIAMQIKQLVDSGEIVLPTAEEDIYV